MSPVARIRGVVEEKGPDWAVIDIGALGLRVNLPATAAAALSVGRTVALHTHLLVREDALTLYGFPAAADLALFETIIGVSGVGPRNALALLSAFEGDELAAVIAAGDIDRLRRVPGIGQKLASRLVLELEGKLMMTVPAPLAAQPARSPETDEVMGALAALGYSQAEASAAVAALPDNGDAPVEERLRRALAWFARR